MSDDQIARIDMLAQRLVQLYEAEKRKKNPWYRLSASNMRHFLLAAQRAAELGFSAEKYFKAVTKDINIETIYPTMFPSLKVSDQVQNSSTISEASLISMFKSRLVENLQNRNRPLEVTLLDDNLKLPAWFRITCLKTEIPAVSEKYLEQAKKEIRQKPTLLSDIRDAQLNYRPLL